MIAVIGDTFNRRDFLADSRGGGSAAGAHRLSVDMNRACTALPDTAAELRSRQADIVANHPQQGRLRIRINGMTRCVHGEIKCHTCLLDNRRICNAQYSIRAKRDNIFSAKQ
jgi:hypothetical protein